MPEALQTDNGPPPFVTSRGLLGLTKLSVWWIRLGIRLLRTDPAHPEQNGAHERFHGTLKAETGKPVAGNRAAQQRRFNRFIEVYNHERPHDTDLLHQRQVRAGEARGALPPGPPIEREGRNEESATHVPGLRVTHVPV